MEYMSFPVASSTPQVCIGIATSVPRLQSGVDRMKQRRHSLLHRRGHGEEAGAQVRHQNDAKGDAPVISVVVRDGAEDSPRCYALEETLAGGDDRVRGLKVFDVAHVGPHSWCKRRVEAVVGTIRMHDPSERKGSSDISAGVAMNAPKNPEGKRWSCAGDSEEIDEGAAGVAADATGGFWGKADDEVIPRCREDVE